MDATQNTELTVSEVATLLGIPKLEVNRRIHKGDINARKLGWFWVIERSEIERIKGTEWFERYTKQPT